MRKTVLLLIIVAVFLLPSCSVDDVPHNEDNVVSDHQQIDYSFLKVDQGKGYIALSKNDDSGYNRWIPFYFTLETGNQDFDVSEIENILSQNITKIKLISSISGVVYESNVMVWSAYKVRENFFNLSLVVIPGVSELAISEDVELSNIALTINGQEFFYKIEPYIISEKDTISEEIIYVSTATIDTSLTAEKTAKVNYGVCDVAKKGVCKIDLLYPDVFLDIKGYSILGSATDDEVTNYQIELCFNEASPKMVFRPFLVVGFADNTEAILVPTLPAYIS